MTVKGGEKEGGLWHVTKVMSHFQANTSEHMRSEPLELAPGCGCCPLYDYLFVWQGVAVTCTKTCGVQGHAWSWPNHYLHNNYKTCRGCSTTTLQRKKSNLQKSLWDLGFALSNALIVTMWHWAVFLVPVIQISPLSILLNNYKPSLLLRIPHITKWKTLQDNI